MKGFGGKKWEGEIMSLYYNLKTKLKKVFILSIQTSYFPKNKLSKLRKNKQQHFCWFLVTSFSRYCVFRPYFENIYLKLLLEALIFFLSFL